MNTVRMILCGNVEDSRMNPSEKVGVVSVVFVSTEEEKIKNKLKKLQDKNPEKFYMEYVTPLDVDLTSLEHYPSIEIRQGCRCRRQGRPHCGAHLQSYCFPERQ